MGLKEKIIHESLKLFSLKGFLNTPVEEILHRTGSSKGGLYNHFKSKDELLRAVLSEARKIWRQRVLEGVGEVDRPLAKVRLVLVNYRDSYLLDRENIPGGCLFVTLSVELDDQRPDFAAEIDEGFSRFKAMIKRWLDQARAEGELSPQTDTLGLSELLFTGMIGASVLYGMSKSPEDLRRSMDPLLHYLDELSLRGRDRKAAGRQGG